MSSPSSFYRRLSKRPELFRSFSGLDVSEFDSLRSKVGSGYEEHERERLSRKDRKREFGAGGRPFKLPLDDRLLMLLMYYRTYVTSILLGFVFNLDQSNVLKDIRMLEPLVRRNSSHHAMGCVPRKLAVEEQLSDYDRWKKRHHYGERWRVESAISSFKRAFGEHVMSVKWKYMVNEILLKASVYNMFLSARS